jgi:3-oxoacyl-[acyl-carrier protein] reductase
MASRAARRIQRTAAGHSRALPDLSQADAISVGDAATDRFGGVDLSLTNTGGPPAEAPRSASTMAWQTDSIFCCSALSARCGWSSHRCARAAAILVGTSSTVKRRFQTSRCRTSCARGVTALVKTLARRARADQIRVNSLLPGRRDCVA